jgi:hypothetical protein
MIRHFRSPHFKECPMLVATAKGTVTVNAAFLQEIKEENQGLWRSLVELEQLCDKPIGHRLTRLIVEKLAEFHEQLMTQFSLEETFGYFSNPASAPTQLCLAAAKARDEHGHLLYGLRQVVDEAEQMLLEERYFELWVWVGQRFLRFAKRLRSHEETECALMLDATGRNAMGFSAMGFNASALNTMGMRIGVAD